MTITDARASLLDGELSRFSLDRLVGTIERARPRVSSPWAVLLVHFQDDSTSALPARDTYEQLFTSAGSGDGNNMVDFFSDMSHGQLDLSGSRVFGWFSLPANRSDYVGNTSPVPPGRIDRNGLLALARTTATSQGVDLSSYSGVVVCGLGAVDLCGWIGGMAALCDSYSLQPSLLGQEMGHGYGLDHARLDGSEADYMDPWDVMSTAAAYEDADPEFTDIGPGLNAWSMRSRGWLDESRVWAPHGDLPFEQDVVLRPLHRHDLRGFLAAEIGGFLVELRVQERWDAGIPRPCVLVHRFDDNHSYLMRGASGRSDLVAGDRFVSGNPDWPYARYLSVEVLHLDAGSRSATLRLSYRPAQPFPHVPDLVGTVLGGIPVDGDGIIIIGGKVIHVPPRGPVREVLEPLARYAQTPVAGEVGPALAVRRGALEGVVRAALELHAETELVSEPPPFVRKGHLQRIPKQQT